MLPLRTSGGKATLASYSNIASACYRAARSSHPHILPVGSSTASPAQIQYGIAMRHVKAQSSMAPFHSQLRRFVLQRSQQGNKMVSDMTSKKFVPTRRFQSNTAQGSGGGSGGGVFDRLWVSYSRLLETKPLITKSATSFVICGLGDVVCQIAVEKQKEIDWKRLWNMSLVGGILIGPTLHAWYTRLSTVRNGIARLALDQLVFAPSFVPVFFTSLFFLEGRVGEVPGKLKEDWGNVVVTNWMIWIPAQFINLQFVPVKFQVLVANVVALVWNVYLSLTSHRPAVEEAEENS